MLIECAFVPPPKISGVITVMGERKPNTEAIGNHPENHLKARLTGKIVRLADHTKEGRIHKVKEKNEILIHITDFVHK